MKYPALLSAIVASTLLTACGGDDSDNDYSYLRVLHASPDAPAVDVLVDGETVLPNVSFQQGSGYLKLKAGRHTVALKVSGTNDVALTQTVDLQDDGYYSAIAANEVAELELSLIDDSENRLDDDADVTVVHAAPAAGAVDIYVTAANADLIDPTLNAVPFAANATLTAVAAGDYQVRITLDESTDVVYDSGVVALSEDITAVAVNSTKGAAPVSLLLWGAGGVTPLLDNTAEVRVVHAVDAQTVDVYAGGSLLLEDFAYTDVTDYVKVAAGDLSVAVSAPDQGLDNALENLTATVNLARGESYTVIAAGDQGDLSAAQFIVLADERAAADDSKAYVRLVHASSEPLADPVDIFVYANGSTQPSEPAFADVELGQDTGYVALAAGNYTVDIAVDGTTAAAVPGTDNIPLATGDVKTAIAIGTIGGSGLQALLLDDKR